MELELVEKIYFIGIGGIGMSAVAGLAEEAGFSVSGSDQAQVYEPAASMLERLKIEYNKGYSEDNIARAHTDLYIVSAGEDLTNPEVSYLAKNNVPYYSFSALAAALARERIRIVVAGTNGKSTTAGWLGFVLKQLDNSSFMVGAVLNNEGSNFHSGSGHYFIFEGDEYRSTFDDPTPKFHHYRPDIAVLTNLEYDHPDVFESLDQLKDEFGQMLANVPEDGLVIYNADDALLHDLAFRGHARNFSFGIDSPADARAENIKYLPDRTEFEIVNAINKGAPRRESYTIALPGAMNVRNALAAITTLRALGFPYELVSQHLKTYTGIKRRFEVLGEHNGIIVIDDYAHHPTAIARTLEAARLRYPNKRIWAIFEPHTFSRTRATLPELALSFKAADQVIISDIYPARENAKQHDITSDEVVASVQKNHPGARLVHTKTEVLKLLKAQAQPGDVIIVMAVGDFYRLGYELLEAFASGPGA